VANSPTTLSVVESILTPVVRGYRDINKDVMQYYNCSTYIDANGEPVKQEYVYPSGGKKTRTLPKSFRTDQGFKTDELFGMDKFNAGCAKAVTITEGELDAMSAYQMLGSKYPVVSLPSATPSGKLFEKCKDWLDSFEKIYLSFDSDGKSDGVAQKLANIFPNRVYNVPHDKYKDANEFLQAGAETELKWAALKPQRYSPDNFYVSLDRFQNLLREETPYEFVPTPCVALNEAIQGHTKGGMTLYKAYPGSGKTTLFRYFQYDLLKNTDQKIAVLHLEEAKSTTLRGLASYELGKNVNTKVSAADNGVTEEEIQKCLSSFIKDDNLILFEFTPSDYGDIFEACLRYVRMAITAYGANYIFLDHVQRLAYMAGVEDATRNLTTFAVKVEDICREFNVGFNAISHLNNEGAAKYAKSLEESCIISIDLMRDKDSEDEVEQNTIQLSIPGKNRPWAKLGEAGKLFYNSETTLLEEI